VLKIWDHCVDCWLNRGEMSGVLDWLLDEHHGLIENNKFLDKSYQYLDDDVLLNQLLKQHLQMEFAYSVLTTELAYELKHQMSLHSSYQSKEQFKKKLEKALLLAQLLKSLYELYLVVPCDAQSLTNDILIYKSLLEGLGVDSPRLDNEKRQKVSAVSRIVRNTTSSTNWSRLFAIRLKRVFDTISPLIKSFESYQKAISFLDKVADPVISYLSWVFYLPRLLINVSLLLKHLIPGFWMDEHERKLHWQIRLRAQWSRRWFELCNDFVWMSVGLVNCFLLTGIFAASGVYLTVVLYTFDVILALIKFSLETSKYNQLLSECDEKIVHLQSQEQIKDNAALMRLESYRHHLHIRIKYEKQKLLLSVATTFALLGAMVFALPLFYAIPVVPLIGASLVVIICLTSYWIGRRIEKSKPEELPTSVKKLTLNDNVSTTKAQLDRFGMFSAIDENKGVLKRVKSENDIQRLKEAEKAFNLG
jgi:hypothetical protein